MADRVGRLAGLRTATPRHATSPASSAARSRRLWVPGVVVAVLLPAAVTSLTWDRRGTPQAAVPLPAVSIPAPPTATGPPPPAATRRGLQAVRQAAKPGPAATAATASTWILLGPGTDADLPPLLGSYCWAAHGPLTVATSTVDGWVCSPVAQQPVPLDADAMCRWHYGDNAWSDLGNEAVPNSWRCYRDD